MSPILPENRARYPQNWDEIRADILQRARQRCEGENCGIRNRAWGYRDVHGRFQDLGRKQLEAVGYTKPPFNLNVRDRAGERVVRVIEIVLTIAHLDHRPENNDPSNLKALCQKCHNVYDREHRAMTRRIRAAAGQGVLPGVL